MQKNAKQTLLDNAEVLTGYSLKREKIPSKLTIYIFTILCLIAIINGLYYLQTRQTKETIAAPIKLTEFDISDISNVQIILSEQSYVLYACNDLYKIEGLENFEVDSSKAARIIAQCANLDAQEVVQEKVNNMVDYGLCNPKSILKVKTKEGKTTTIYIGEQSPIASFYTCIAGQKIVYSLPSTVVEGLLVPLNDLHAVKTPMIAEPYSPAFCLLNGRTKRKNADLEKLEEHICH